MTARQFSEWQVFEALEPFDHERLDQLFASVVQVIANAHRDKRRKRGPYTLDDARQYFGDSRPDKKPLTWQEMKSIARQFAQDANRRQVHQERHGRRRR